MNHEEHAHGEDQEKTIEYVKFVVVMAVIICAAFLDASWPSFSLSRFLASFMGVFFVVFAGFKIYNLREFAYGFQSYDLIAKHSLAYSYAYPFMQLGFGILYFISAQSVLLNLVVLLVSLVSGAGVLNSLMSKQQVHCVCLGNVIKLPLSTISFVEDFGMALMAAAMLVV